MFCSHVCRWCDREAESRMGDGRAELEHNGEIMECDFCSARDDAVLFVVTKKCDRNLHDLRKLKTKTGNCKAMTFQETHTNRQKTCSVISDITERQHSVEWHMETLMGDTNDCCLNLEVSKNFRLSVNLPLLANGNEKRNEENSEVKYCPEVFKCVRQYNGAQWRKPLKRRYVS